MRLFKPKAEKQREAINRLRSSVLECTLSVSEKLISTIESERSTISDEENYGINQEILCFYLLFVDRIAMENSDRLFYEKLQDAMLVSTCELFVDMQFNVKEVKEGFDVENWRTRMIHDNIELYNERGDMYATLPLVADEDLSNDGNVLVKVVENIIEFLGSNSSVGLSSMREIPFWLIQTANDNQLVQQIHDVRKILK